MIVNLMPMRMYEVRVTYDIAITKLGTFEQRTLNNLTNWFIIKRNIKTAICLK